MRKIVILLTVSAFFISCKSTKVEKTTFNGMIYDGDNEPVSGVQIFLDEKHQTVSDMYGRFYFENLITNKEYTLTATKKDFETAQITFEFQNITQVAYLTMYSSEQLLKQAEKSLTENNTITARALVDRAEICGGKSLSSLYLQAVILYKESNSNEALNILLDLSSQGYNNPYIYLFMADIYQYDIKDIELAKSNLQKYLSTTYDLETEKRYKELCAQ